MSTNFVPPDVEKVLAGLKDFQRQTVEYAFQRLYLDADATHRFLVADEVGLGKTLVARGLIVKAIDYLAKQGVPRIDVVYICSNAEIARQNINRLNYSGAQEFSLASRITLLPITLKALKNQRVNFISFTPTTSFDLQSSLGIVRERALLLLLIERAWQIKETQALNVLQGMANVDTFREEVKWMRKDETLTIDQDLADDFARALREDEARGAEGLKERFFALCDRYQRTKKYARDDDRNRWIGEARKLLASTCLRALEPDLIILDEFQRFRHLLDANDESAELAQGLFTYADEHTAARVVLLSATPYKMYTAHHEESEEGHYRDFLLTYEFLSNTQGSAEHLGEVLKRYRSELFNLPEGSERLREVKFEIEQLLGKVMVRTERLAVSEDREGMLKEIPGAGVRLDKDDLHEYVGLSRIASILGRGDTIEYWKSTPYALSFMDGYKLKEEFRDGLGDSETQSELSAIVAGSKGTLLNREDVETYSKIDPLNSRLRGLVWDVIDRDAWKLLWLPPSLPYYRLNGPFAGEGVSSLTKRLVFSAWKVVPKTIAALMSYEVERRMLNLWNEGEMNTEGARRRRRGLLRLNVSEGRAAGMPVLGLIYPSSTLSRLGDLLPVAAKAELAREIPDLEEVLAIVENRIAKHLDVLGLRGTNDGPDDERWYWAAPFLLDVLDEESGARLWLDHDDLALRWTGQAGADSEDEEVGEGWTAHIDRVREIVRDPGQLGRQPDDLIRVLARIAIAGPGVAGLRSLQRASGIDLGAPVPDGVRSAAASVASAFRTLFNIGEVVALVRGLRKSEDVRGELPYWRLVLDYSVDGGLQAVLDEYAHVIRGSAGLIAQNPENIAAGVAERFVNGLSVRVGQLGVDVVQQDRRTELESITMRGRFAMRYGDEKVDALKGNVRADQVRDAFNSPFWPFVLATTSVGQEGLDFHHYCHAVVHWNLPSNPVDLEQREGRVHRYKGHAVRKNIASKYGHTRALSETSDPWEGLFAHAARERAPGSTDLVPYWVFPIEGGATIERHAPSLPLSRDRERLETLRRSLAVYRMVFGQSRQEDLLAYLAGRIDSAQLAEFRSLLQIDLSPPSTEQLAATAKGCVAD